MTHPAPVRAAFIGSAGIPNRYGGFEAFLEHCAPEFAARTLSTTVTCDRRLYVDRTPSYQGVQRLFLRTPANGGWSILHDLMAFIRVFASSTHIVVLGVSGGPWFPMFRLLCSIAGKRLLVNIDGVEWRRNKFSPLRRLLLRCFDALAQRCAHTVIYDNAALLDFVFAGCRSKAVQIGYSGDHVLRLPTVVRQASTGLTVCRIEPENNIDMLIEGVLRSGLKRYTVVGNWDYSDYGRELRGRHAGDPRLQLLGPIYDPEQLAILRESCDVYIHGHSVGGTNPSLVEMLFYDCRLLCFDVPFHRETAGSCAQFFGSAVALTALLDASDETGGDRAQRRDQFSRSVIARTYVSAMLGASVSEP